MTPRPREVPAGRVVGVREQGWKFRGEILRPAGVVVSAGPEQARAHVHCPTASVE